MKQLTWKLVLPLTIIFFATITKWWYVSPVDAPETLYSGFPFPFMGDGWHTSMSLQFFVFEFFVDFTIYFILCFITLFYINRFLIAVKIHKMLMMGLWTISVFIISLIIFIASFPDNIFYFKRPYNMEIIETGYKFYWQHLERPNYYKYHPQSKRS